MAGEGFFRAAFSYLYIGEYERAMEAFEKAIKADPLQSSYYFHASVTALRNEFLDEARTWAEAAASLEPQSPLYAQHVDTVIAQQWVQQARIAHSGGDTERAKSLLKQAVERDPLNESATDLLEKLI